MTTQVGVAGHIIKRPRLTRILDETDARIILLCAPAGYGKTTLAREWVATRKEPVLWYSGGPAMADVAALAVDLAELFGGVDSELVERVRFLASRGEGPRTLAKILARDAPEAETLLVVDDCHHMAAMSDADRLFQELVAAGRFRTLLTTRVRPAWTQPRLVIYGETFLIGTRELAFTPTEAQQVMPTAADVLGGASEWPALVALATFGSNSPESSVRLSRDQLYEFFAADLFESVDASLQRALYLLAAGGDASPSVARRLLGRRVVEMTQAALDRGFALRDAAGWIEIHPLVRHFLLARLRMSDPEVVMDVVRSVVHELRRDCYWDTCLAVLEQFPIEDDAT